MFETGREVVKRKAEKFDKDLFKARDLEILTQVVSYLQGHGLNVELRGSAYKNAEDGNPRAYRDIDLLITGDQRQKGDAILGLVATYNLAGRFQPQSVNVVNYSIERVGGEQQYVDTTIENRYALRMGRTTIDLCFTKNSN